MSERDGLLNELRGREVPSWYRDAKLGIFVSWGPFSVPGWAPTEQGEMRFDQLGPEWFTNNPYAEWYLNSLRIDGSPTQAYHHQHYGDMPFEAFVDMWDTSSWDPASWAELFRRAGARYVVMLTKHHDGYNLWPTELSEHSVGSRGPDRDLIGETTQAVRAQGLEMGLYYSGGLDWRFTADPILYLEDLERIVPGTEAYAEYADASVRELIERYEPSVLWNDIGWPKEGRHALPALFRDYYGRVPRGVVNDRWSIDYSDFATHEYEVPDEPSEGAWETIRGLGYSFGYNRNETEAETLGGTALIRLLVDVVSRNGNLLINVGPRADGSIPELQQRALLELGSWLARNGEAIFGSRPWRTSRATVDGSDVYFTTNHGALYCVFSSWPESEVLLDLVLSDTEPAAASIVGLDLPVDARREGDRLHLRLPADAPRDQAMPVVRLDGLGS